MSDYATVLLRPHTGAPLTEIELADIVPVLIDGFRTRIPERYRASFDEELDGGEYGLAVEHLVSLIRQCQIPVDGDEALLLRWVCAFCGLDAGPMGQAEFHAALPKLVDKLRDRIKPQFREGFDEEIEVGEYRLAVTNLVCCVREHGLVLSGTEAKTLRDCLAYLGEDATCLDNQSATKDFR